MGKTYEEVVQWIEEQMRLQGINKAELARRGDMTQGSLSNVLSGKRGMSQRLAKKIAAGLSIPQTVAFRGLGIADDDETKTTETGQYFADLLEEIEDDDQREQTIAIVEAVIRQVAAQTRARNTKNRTRRANPTTRPEG